VSWQKKYRVFFFVETTLTVAVSAKAREFVITTFDTGISRF
jgi:hypothetical protein